MSAITSGRSPRTPEAIQARRLSLADIVGAGNKLPNRIALHAVEGFGKTSLAAQIPGVVFLQTRGETGLETLIDAGQLPEVPHFPEINTWKELLDCIDMLTTETHDYKAVAIDVVNGAERLCHEEVCRRDFGGDWGEKGFTSYNKGFTVALTDWIGFLTKLDKLRETRRMGIMLLCHTKVTNFKNPEGPDYDRYQPDMNQGTWAATAKWADAVFFGNFEVTVAGGTLGEGTKAGRKGKGVGSIRMLYTERTAAYDAKNRLGLPAEIEMGNSAKEAWAKLRAEMANARKSNQPEGKE